MEALFVYEVNRSENDLCICIYFARGFNLSDQDSNIENTQNFEMLEIRFFSLVSRKQKTISTKTKTRIFHS